MGEADDVVGENWDCIVHVGDMASLALSRQRHVDEKAEEMRDSKRTDTSTLTSTELSTISRIQWPSPRHRVVCSPTFYRTSLVYFAYPPASCSIEAMQRALEMTKNNDVKFDEKNEDGLPLRDYYLLHDQSSNVSCSTADETKSRDVSAHAAFRRVKFQSISGVIQAKWNQVQRVADA